MNGTVIEPESAFDRLARDRDDYLSSAAKESISGAVLLCAKVETSTQKSSASLMKIDSVIGDSELARDSGEFF